MLYGMRMTRKSCDGTVPWYCKEQYRCTDGAVPWQQVGQNTWLAVWSNATTHAEQAGQELSVVPYLAVYFVLGMLSLGMQIGRSYWAVQGTVSAARRCGLFPSLPLTLTPFFVGILCRLLLREGVDYDSR